MDNLVYLTDHEKINEVLKTRHSDTFVLLYVSPWCDWSRKMEVLADEWASRHPLIPVYVISSWHTPEAFGTFSITSAPSMIAFNNNTIKVVVEYPSVYNYFSK
mgnify:CR=1 FL=1